MTCHEDNTKPPPAKPRPAVRAAHTLPHQYRYAHSPTSPASPRLPQALLHRRHNLLWLHISCRPCQHAGLAEPGRGRARGQGVCEPGEAGSSAQGANEHACTVHLARPQAWGRHAGCRGRRPVPHTLQHTHPHAATSHNNAHLQPRVQPRRISTVMRSCTVSTYGTSPICNTITRKLRRLRARMNQPTRGRGGPGGPSTGAVRVVHTPLVLDGARRPRAGLPRPRICRAAALEGPALAAGNQPPTHPPTSTTHPPTHPPQPPTHPSTHPATHPPTYPATHPSTHLPSHPPSTHPPTCWKGSGWQVRRFTRAGTPSTTGTTLPPKP